MCICIYVEEKKDGPIRRSLWGHPCSLARTHISSRPRTPDGSVDGLHLAAITPNLRRVQFTWHVFSSLFTVLVLFTLCFVALWNTRKVPNDDYRFHMLFFLFLFHISFAFVCRRFRRQCFLNSTFSFCGFTFFDCKDTWLVIWLYV